MTWAERIESQWNDDDYSFSRRLNNASERGRKLVAFMSTMTWHVFWTQTYRRRTTAFGAQAIWLRFLAEFNSHSTVTGVTWAVERHASGLSHHVHALLSMKSRPSCTNWRNVYRPWKEWAWRTMGKALILRTNHNTPVWYVLKYVTKKVNESADPLPWGILTGPDVPGTIQ